MFWVLYIEETKKTFPNLKNILRMCLPKAQMLSVAVIDPKPLNIFRIEEFGMCITVFINLI